MTTTSCLTVKIEQCLSKTLDPINVFIFSTEGATASQSEPTGKEIRADEGVQEASGGMAVHLGKSKRRCGPKHSPQEEGKRQRPEQGRDEATPGQTDRLAIPRGGGYGAGLELRGVVQAGHGRGCRQGWEETLQCPQSTPGRGRGQFCDQQGDPGGGDVSHNSSPTAHTHTADGEAERLTCPCVSPVWKGQSPEQPGNSTTEATGQEGF